MFKQMWNNYLYEQVKKGRVERKPEWVIGKIMRSIWYIAWFITLMILSYEIVWSLSSYWKTDNQISFAILLTLSLVLFILALAVIFKIINKK